MQVKQLARDTGLECARIIAMFMIIVGHLLEHGGVKENLKFGSINYIIVWLMVSLSYCAVNVFILITGYVYANKTWKLSRIIRLWVIVFFYSFLFSIIRYFDGGGIADIIKGLFPILTKQYWFFNAYFGMFVLMPALNTIAQNKQILKGTIISSILIFSIMPVFAAQADIFNTNNGYSVIWFCVLYLIGTYCKLYHKRRSSREMYIVMYLLSALLLAVSRYALDGITGLIQSERHGGLLFVYTSPIVLFEALSLFLFFSDMSFYKDWKKKLVCYLSSTTFGIYLIHDNKTVRSIVFNDAVANLARENPIQLLYHIILFALLVFFVSAFFEAIRQKLFDIVLFDQKIDQAIVGVQRKVKEKIQM